VRFNQPANFVEARKDILNVPLPDADPHKFELFRQQCQAENSLRSQSRPFVTDSVKLHFQIGKGNVTFRDIARKLNMSERSLRDKLVNEGSSFRKIKNNYVFQQSLNLLSNPGLSIENIAEELGYSETCAFTRAFEKLAGMSPGRYRRKIMVKTHSAD
jgi:AraC-like DNA-binding protein